MSIEEQLERLNESVPCGTVIRVQLRQIKQLEEETYRLEKLIEDQEVIIDELLAKIKRLERDLMSIYLVAQYMSKEERKILKEDYHFSEISYVNKILRPQVKERETVRKQMVNKLCALYRKLDAIDK